jgi:transposase InsO family protein
MTRQNYYKKKTTRERREVNEEKVIELVRRERRVQPRLGGRKLYHELRAELEAGGIEIGRDRFFEVLRKYDLLVEPLPKGARTTNSRHSLPVYRNLIKDLEVTGPNQAWVSDITYLRTDVGYEYLALVMDLFSHKIVGSSCSADLSTQGALGALDEALSELPEGYGPIHHSDRGCQYCSHKYVNRATESGLRMSMTEENHCAENSVAERLNGILKQEYGLRNSFRSRGQARRAVAQAVELYNTRRPHTTLGMRKPAEVHALAA